MEKKITVDFDSFLFKNVFTKVCKQIHYPKTEATVIVVNKEKTEKLKKIVKNIYKFIFDYPLNNNEIVGIEVIYLGEKNE